MVNGIFEAWVAADCRRRTYFPLAQYSRETCEGRSLGQMPGSSMGCTQSLSNPKLQSTAIERSIVQATNQQLQEGLSYSLKERLLYFLARAAAVVAVGKKKSCCCNGYTCRRGPRPRHRCEDSSTLTKVYVAVCFRPLRSCGYEFYADLRGCGRWFAQLDDGGVYHCLKRVVHVRSDH